MRQPTIEKSRENVGDNPAEMEWASFGVGGVTELLATVDFRSARDPGTIHEGKINLEGVRSMVTGPMWSFVGSWNDSIFRFSISLNTG